MAALLGSWWSGNTTEEMKKDEETKKEKKSENEDSSTPEKKEESWVSGFEGLVRNVSEYAATVSGRVSETVKTVVQEKPSFMTQFQEEQDKFTREKRRLQDAAVPPWVGYNEEEQMKAQILELSADSRNVLRNPPPGVQFSFDFGKSYPVAMAVLKEDTRLQALRFDLVPKKVSEQKFWHNYFYRVFLIKQSLQLASVSSVEKQASISSDTAEEKSGEGEEKGKLSSEAVTDGFVMSDHQSPGQEEFASDSLPAVSGEITRDTMKAELDQLGVANREGGEGGEGEGLKVGGGGEGEGKDNSVWEEQLQQELEDMELQGLSGGGRAEEGAGLAEVDSETWEAELQEMLNMHSQDPPPTST